MRYRAETIFTGSGRIPALTVYIDGLDERLALRHARAMAAVLRASKAWRRGYHIHLSCSKAWVKLEMRLAAAVARLEKVEREVRRG